MENISGNTILITGGASGIGRALAERFWRDKNQVIILGRRGERLNQAANELPGIHTIQGDMSTADERIRLVSEVLKRFPELNVVVNNAGIQQSVNLSQGNPEEWLRISNEIDINLSAPIHSTLLFTSHLLKQKNPAIINITSGLSFVPLADTPIYSATKAAMHSYHWSLRFQLRTTPIKVIEIAPPAIDTDLNAPGLHTWGVDVNVFSDAVYKELCSGNDEIAYGFSELGMKGYRSAIEKPFAMLNQDVAAAQHLKEENDGNK